jgi:tRNA threonylcarbamoyladenosine biosynthesis protein TsaB
MKQSVLYIDTSDQELVVVQLLEGDHKIAEQTANNRFGSQALLGLIEQLIKESNISYQDLSEVKVATGPGSFTGLRVGASVGQALAFGLNIPINGQIGHPVELQYSYN